MDNHIIDYLNIHKIKLWNTGGKTKYWTVLFFTSDKKDFPNGAEIVSCDYQIKTFKMGEKR